MIDILENMIVLSAELAANIVKQDNIVTIENKTEDHNPTYIEVDEDSTELSDYSL